MRDIAILDRAVYPHDQPSDSDAKASHRWWWTRVSSVLLAVALIGTGVTAWGEREFAGDDIDRDASRPDKRRDADAGV